MIWKKLLLIWGIVAIIAFLIAIIGELNGSPPFSNSGFMLLFIPFGIGALWLRFLVWTDEKK
jgi:hypothetical protein